MLHHITHDYLNFLGNHTQTRRSRFRVQILLVHHQIWQGKIWNWWWLVSWLSQQSVQWWRTWYFFVKSWRTVWCFVDYQSNVWHRCTWYEMISVINFSLTSRNLPISSIGCGLKWKSILKKVKCINFRQFQFLLAFCSRMIHC